MDWKREIRVNGKVIPLPDAKRFIPKPQEEKHGGNDPSES